MEIKDRYKNKYFSILGDSISTLEGYSEPYEFAFYNLEKKFEADVFSEIDTWWGKVIDALGGKLLKNNSISGSTVVWSRGYDLPNYGCSDERTQSLKSGDISPDVIIVYMGTNDWGRGVTVTHEKQGDTEEKDLTVFSDAYGVMLEKLRGNYLSAEIWCVSLGVSRWTGNDSFKFPFYKNGKHILEYCNAIKSCVNQLGGRFLDIYHSEEDYDTIDGYHPNASGMQTIANSILNQLK